LKKTVEIQFKNRFLSNKIGNVLFGIIAVLVFVYFFAAWFDQWNKEQNFLFFLIILIGIVIAGSLSYYRTFEKAELNFIPEGIIIESKIGFIPIKYNNIEYFKSDGIPDSENNTIEFIIQTTDKKSYRIKSKFEVYEGLIQTFPHKNGKYTW